MKTFTFSQLPALRDFRFLTDSSGYVLTQTGQLYQFVGQRTTRVATPEQFTVSHFYFRDEAHGAIVGTAQAAKPAVQRGSLGAAALPLLLLAWLAYRRHRSPTAPRLLASGGAAMLAGGLLLACSTSLPRYRTPDPTSPHATVLTQPLLSQPTFHQYVGNKGQRAYIALTENQGGSWDTRQIPSNFFPTALVAVGRNFWVGTYARPEAGTVPLHGDGDIWLYGTDATQAPQLVANSAQHPFSIRLSRGVAGFHVAASDSVVYIFGSDRMPTLPSTAMSTVAGNIYVVPATLHPPTRLLDTPDTVDVQSLSRASSGELWVTMAGRKPYLSHGNLGYQPLPAQRLLHFVAGRWRAVQVPPFTSFAQVEFVPATALGYVLTDTGQLLETRTDGASWTLLPLAGPAVRKLHARPHAITWLQGDQQLVYYQAATSN